MAFGSETCERTLYGQTTKQSCCPWIRVVFGGHREMVGEEMEGVDVMGRVERSVEDRVQTTTITNET